MLDSITVVHILIGTYDKKNIIDFFKTGTMRNYTFSLFHFLFFFFCFINYYFVKCWSFCVLSAPPPTP